MVKYAGVRLLASTEKEVQAALATLSEALGESFHPGTPKQNQKGSWLVYCSLEIAPEKLYGFQKTGQSQKTVMVSQSNQPDEEHFEAPSLEDADDLNCSRPVSRPQRPQWPSKEELKKRNVGSGPTRPQSGDWSPPEETS